MLLIILFIWFKYKSPFEKIFNNKYVEICNIFLVVSKFLEFYNKNLDKNKILKNIKIKFNCFIAFKINYTKNKEKLLILNWFHKIFYYYYYY